MEGNGMENSRHIEKCPPSYSVCTGCGSCEIICSLVHEGLASPSCNRIFVQQGPTNKLIFHVYTCQQCQEPTCYEACPLKDKAMTIDENGTVVINEAVCIGCGKCQNACKYKPSRINLVKSKDKNERKAKKCDLCKGRPEGPACVQWCPAKCLELNDKPLPWETGQEEGEQDA